MTRNKQPITRDRRDRGVALITALLLLSLFTVMTLSMVIATTSDTLIDGYYRNARGSFYAADSGINAARQALLNQISNNALPATYTPSNGSPVLTNPATLLANLESSSTGFGSYQSIIGSQTASWPATFMIDASKTSMGYGTPACSPLPLCNNGSTGPIVGNTPYIYYYSYHLTADGTSRSNEVNVVEEWGTITYTINMNPTSSTTTSFAAYGTLLDQYALCSGAFVPGTMSGQFFSNQSWNYGDSTWNGSSTKYVFTGNVGAVNTKVGYMYGSDGSCDQSANTSDSHRGVTINPTFSGGLTLGQTAIPMPTNSYNQLSAVLDGLGDCPPAPASCSAPSNARMAVLTNAAGTSWTSSTSTGVFMPYTSTTVAGVTTKTLNSSAGGIYVEGNTDSVLMTASTATVSGSTHKLQVFAIQQGSTTTTVTLDITGGTTAIADNQGHSTGTMVGIPSNLNVSPATEGALLYVNGDVSGTSGHTTTGLSGPSSGAAVQDGSAITLVSTGTIAITGNITYSTKPVALTTADTAVIPAPTNVLGIYTSGGNIQLRPPTDVANLEVDASIATIASGASYGIIATWNNITNFNLVGGRVQNMALSGASLTARNIYFDQRFANGFAPPWFPTTTVTSSTTNTANPAPPVVNRTSWVNSSAQ